jgi:hypothetical protein
MSETDGVMPMVMGGRTVGFVLFILAKKLAP